MKCIPAGPFVMGKVHGPEDAFPAHEVFVDTFYMDTYEVTNQQYKACVAAGVCEKKTDYIGFKLPDQPALPVTWHNASALCRWKKKSLPTEAQWEKAAAGGRQQDYPWGDEPPDCAKAAYKDCNLPAARPVGSYAPNGYGLYDMAGNSYEWTRDWFAPCIEGCEDACGDECRGSNPGGPCDGRAPCKGRKFRVLKGGSWHWGPAMLAVAHRRPMLPDSGDHRLGFRCAMDASAVRTAKEPSPLTDEEKKIFFSSAQDDPPVERMDERHYVHSNESAHFLFFPFIENLGGGYVGIGSDQNYTMIAKSRPELAWIFDYDETVTLIHGAHRALILEAGSPEEFLGLWEKDSVQKAAAAIRKHAAGSGRLDEIEKTYMHYRENVHAYFSATMKKSESGKTITWLTDPESYAFVKKMYAADRIRAMTGDLLGERALPGIGETAKKLGVTIRVIYFTNAEEFIFYRKNFVNGFKSFPVDDKSVILRTLHSKKGYEDADHKWHYNVHGVRDFLMRLDKGVNKIQKFTGIRQKTTIKGLSTIWI
ncbi:MAG: SUMF1/EgtB/PvdO family nonheme iron enzyme [Pseudomonadota bacterium]